MVLISKREMEYLLSKGCVWGEDLHHTYSSHKKYYLTESNRNLQKLNKYRSSQIMK